MAAQHSANLLSLLETGVFADAEIHCRGRVWTVHKSILSAQSTFFNKAFTGPWTEATSRSVELSETDPDVLDVLIKCFYGEPVLPYDDPKPVAGGPSKPAAREASNPAASESSRRKHCDDLHPGLGMMHAHCQAPDSSLAEDDPVVQAVESRTHLEKYMRLWIEADFFGMAGLSRTISLKIKQELVGATYGLTVFRTDLYPAVEGQMEVLRRSMATSLIPDLQRAVPLAYEVPGPVARRLQLHFVACVVSARDHLRVPALEDLMATHSEFAQDMVSCLTRMTFKNAAPDGFHIKTSMRTRVARRMSGSHGSLYECMSPECKKVLLTERTMVLDHWSHGDTRWCGSCGLRETKRAAENFVAKAMEREEAGEEGKEDK